MSDSTPIDPEVTKARKAFWSDIALIVSLFSLIGTGFYLIWHIKLPLIGT